MRAVWVAPSFVANVRRNTRRGCVSNQPVAVLRRCDQRMRRSLFDDHDHEVGCSVVQLVGRDSDEFDEVLLCFLSWRGVWFGAYLTYIRYLTLCKGRQLEIEEERYTTIPYNFIFARLFEDLA